MNAIRTSIHGSMALLLIGTVSAGSVGVISLTGMPDVGMLACTSGEGKA